MLKNISMFLQLAEEEYGKAVEEYTVFGRVKPEQNEICATVKGKNTVAMTGDGVNDILAMKRSRL